jgi:hypothetical protein
MSAASTLPPSIRSFLNDFVVRVRRIALMRAAGIALASFAAWMLAWCLVDRFAQLPSGLRLAALVVGITAVLIRLVPCVIRLRRRPDLVSAAAAVERQHPRFGQRLLTVTSQLLGARQYRGSDEILIRLTREVGDQVAVERSGRLVPLRPAIRPVAACLLLAILAAALLQIPSLRLGALAGRFLEPLANIPPVTTTGLVVTPGNTDVMQSRPVTIDVRADRLGDSPVTLYLNGDDRDWTRVAMSPMGGGRFTFNVASVDRDLRYYVTGGDARTPDYTIRVLRPPTISQFRIRYEYPPYTRLPPAVVTNTDGHLEAPAGTKVHLSVTATEPLQSALLTIGNDRMLMDHGADAFSRRAELIVRTDAKYTIDLISAREVSGTGPAGTSIRAVPDLPPQVRLARGGDSLRLSPRGIIPVWYEAIDDYGIKSLEFRAQVNDQSPVGRPVRLWGDPRRQQSVFNFDLATLPIGIGDVVTLTGVATDTFGHSTESLPLRVIIAPRSIDLDAWERIGELRTAGQLSRSLADQFEDAVKGRAEADASKDHASPAFMAAESRADRALSTASQTATLLRQSLLRAITHSHSAPLSIALAGWVDAAEVESAAADDAFRRGGAAGALPALQRDRLQAALGQIRAVQPQIAAVGQGEQAAAVLADYENLQAARKRAIPKDEPSRRRLRDTIERMRQDISTDAGQMGLDGAANDLENPLRQRIRAEQDVISSAKPVDFVAVAEQWSQQVRRDPRQRLGLESRLSVATQAEAIRPDADLIRARDLELASRAAGTLAAAARGGRSLSAEVLNSFVGDLKTLLRDPGPKPGAAASVARQDLVRLAEDATAISTRAASFAIEDRQKDAETLALQASAAAADHKYQQAATLDQAMVRRLEQPAQHEPSVASAPASVVPTERLEHQQQAVQQEMTAAQTLDDLGRRQEALTGDATRPAQVADQQRDVADQIAGVERQKEEGSLWSTAAGANGRDRAASEVLAAQEQLSSMPQALAAAQTSADARREAAMRAGLATDAANSAGADQRDAAERAAEAAEQNASDAAARLDASLQPISPKAAQTLAERLDPFAPETDGARASLLGQLAPAFEALDRALRGDDATAAERAADEARRAMEACQRDLAATQDLLMRRDPLVAARWFAKAAAESLSMVPPDVGHARSHQANASVALSRAWDQSIHKAAAERLSSLPSLSAVLGVPPAGPAGQGNQQGSRFAAAREWGRMRPQEGPDLNTSMHDADPPGFEASLKLYFEALGKAQEAK